MKPLIQLQKILLSLILVFNFSFLPIKAIGSPPVWVREIGDGNVGSIVDTIYYNNKIYALADNGIVFLYELDGTYIDEFDLTDSPYFLSGALGMDVDSSGNIYIVDTDNNKIQIFDSDLNFVDEFGSLGSGDGEFDVPVDIAIYNSNIYVLDAVNTRIEVFDSDLIFQDSFVDNSFLSCNPRSIDLDSNGNIYVIDLCSDSIGVYDYNGVFQFSFGQNGSGDGEFDQAIELFIDSNDNLYVADTGNSRIQIFDTDGNYQYQFGVYGFGDGEFDGTSDILTLDGGYILVADSGNGHLDLFNTLNLQINSISIKDSNTTTDFSISDSNPQVKIYYTPTQALTNGSIIEVTYDTAFTGGASLTNSDVSVSGTNITSTVESDFSAGYFKSTLTTSGDVSGEIIITIGDGAAGGLNDLATPSSAGNYSFQALSDNGNLFDAAIGLAYVGNDNDVLITAYVPTMIDLELYQTDSDSELVDSNVCNLGQLSINQVKTCSYDIGWTTNLSSGMTVKILADDFLNSGANTINDVSDGTVSSGSEEYGIRLSNLGTGCTASGSGTFFTQDTSIPTSPTNFFTTSTSCDGTYTAQSAKRVEVLHKVSIDSSSVVGSYNQSVTYTAFTN